MTYQGAIDELKSLENNEYMPDWFKPTLKKVRETMEMDGRENIDGEWIAYDHGMGLVYLQCPFCGAFVDKRYVEHNFCCKCGVKLSGKSESEDKNDKDN